MSASADHAATVMQETLSGIPTNDLIAELATREGVELYQVKDEEKYIVQKIWNDGNGFIAQTLESYEGPIRIITVVDP